MVVKRMEFFSIKNPKRIGGRKYVPSVCYQVEDHLRKTILDMVSKGEAVPYERKVKFINGRPFEIQEPAPTPEPSIVLGPVKAEEMGGDVVEADVSAKKNKKKPAEILPTSEGDDFSSANPEKEKF